MPNNNTTFSRRTLLQLGLAASGLFSLPLPLVNAAELITPELLKQRYATGTHVVLLGTKGGPTPSPLRAAPANLLLVDGQPYIIDCGNGVAIQLAKAGLPLAKIRDVFITHHHSDHNADMGNLLLLAWGSGLQTPVNLYGPGKLQDMVDHFLAMNAADIKVRQDEEGRPPLKPLIHTHDFTQPGVILDNGQVKVTTALVDHYHVKPALAYRFDTKDRSVVFSGDTTYCPALIELAKGADVLVHEVMYLPALKKLLSADNNAPTLLDHLLKSHTTTEQLGRVAAEAGVKTLVLSHFVPGGDPTITDDMWAADIRQHFHGEIIVGRDLLVV